jgi:hypothetical protein
MKPTAFWATLSHRKAVVLILAIQYVTSTSGGAAFWTGFTTGFPIVAPKLGEAGVLFIGNQFIGELTAAAFLEK